MLSDSGRGGYDVVRGVIVGGDFVSWQLFYDGRPQRGRGTANNDDEAIAAATERKNELVLEYGGWPCYLFQDPTKWEVRMG